MKMPRWAANLITALVTTSLQVAVEEVSRKSPLIGMKSEFPQPKKGSPKENPLSK